VAIVIIKAILFALAAGEAITGGSACPKTWINNARRCNFYRIGK
jgi:hypothetical protein